MPHITWRCKTLTTLAFVCDVFFPNSKFVIRSYNSSANMCLLAVGYKSWADEKGWNGVNRSVLDTEITTKKQSLQNNLDLLLRCQKLGVN